MVHNLEVEDVDSDDEEDDLKDQMTQKYVKRRHDHDLQPQKPACDYSHLYSDLEHTILTQYNIKNRLKIFGDAGMSAMVTEMQQLHDWEVIMIPKHANMLTWEEKQQSLQYLMFMKQKHCGQIRGHGCADGWCSRCTRLRMELVHPLCCWSLCSCHVSSMQRRAGR